MSWPDKVWRPNDPDADDMGMVDFEAPMNVTTQYGIDEGLPEDWKDYDNTIDRVSAWDAMDNPLYEAAAGALDIDWDELKEKFKNDIGDEDTYERPESESDGGTKTYGGGVPGGSGMPASIGVESAVEQAGILSVLDGEDSKTPYDWGISNSEIEQDLNDMQDWLEETVSEAEAQKGYSGTGPSSANYANIDGDIWEHFGLDKPPAKAEVLSDDHFKYKDSPSNYDIAVRDSSGNGEYTNPWITAGVWLGRGEGVTALTEDEGRTTGHTRNSMHKADQPGGSQSQHA